MKKDFIKYGLFFGGILGVLEATLGYILHLLPSGISGAIMYPILFAIGVMAYKSSNSLKSVYVMSGTAALIKLTNLAVPLLPAVKVVNPAIAILLEGLSVALVIKYTIDRQKEFDFNTILVGSFSWRAIYLMYLTVNFILGIKGRMIESGTLAIVEYLSYGLINAVLINAVAKLTNKTSINIGAFRATKIGTVCAISLAIVIQIIGA